MPYTEQAIKISELIARYIQQDLTLEEQKELDNWIDSNPANKILFSNITNEAVLKNELMLLKTASPEKQWQRIQIALASSVAPVVPMKHRSQTKWIAVASIMFLVVCSAIIYQLSNNDRQKKGNTREQIITEIKPGSNKASLQLADGSVIMLDSVANGALTNHNTVKVIKLDGKLTYSGKTEKPNELSYNTVTTPRGGKYQLELSDGSIVWLNAASSLRFPISFTGNERKVEVTGEAYFQVSKNAQKPFKVVVPGKGEIEVLGTQFNVNSYTDEEAVNTTLVEGKVKFSAVNGESKNLKPGQQVSMNNKLSVKEVDLDEVIAWKTGWFNFNRSEITVIMRQISRWYDVDVVFEDEPLNKTFSGVVNRNNNLTDVLKVMEKVGVRFKIEGKKIVVLH